MRKYVIKSNIPSDKVDYNARWSTEERATKDFFDIASRLSEEYPISVVFNNKILRGTICAEIDGFFYYVELYKEGL